MRGPARFCFLILATAVAGGCGLLSDPPLTPPIVIELGTRQVEVVAGLKGIGPGYQLVSAPIPITVKRNGYTGPLTLSVELRGTSSGPSFQTFFPDSVGSISVSAAEGVAGGTYQARVTVATDGQGSKSETISVIVGAFVGGPMQRSMVVAAGSTNTISLDLRPFSTATTVSALGATGITASVVTANSTPYVDVTASTPGTYQLTVTASQSGFQRSWPIQVIVQPAQSKTTVSFKLCRNSFALGGGISAFYNTTFVAAANEGEPWTRLTADASGVYTFAATDRVSIAEVFTYGLGIYAPGTAVRVMQMTATELAALKCNRSSGTKTLRTSATNATSYFMAIGYARAHNATFATGVVADGPLDMIASGAVSVTGGSEYRSIVRRAVNLVANDTVRLDFASGEAVVLDSATLLVPEATAVPTTHVHAATTIARLGGVNSTATNKYWGLRESQLAASEVQSVTVGTSTRGVVKYFRAVAPLSLTLGPEAATPVADTATLTIRLPRQAEYPDIAGVGQLTTKDGRGVYNYTEIWQTSGYAGSAGTDWTFAFPDLGRVHRVDPLTQGGTLGAIAGNGPAKLFFGGAAAAGDEIRWAKRTPSQFGIFLPYPNGY